MPLLNRETLVDRPTLVDRADEEDEQDDNESGVSAVEVLGEGGGPSLHGIEFEPGDYNVVAGANTAAVLATGEQEGDAFESSFVNAAIQLRELIMEGDDVRDLARFGLEKGVAEIGLDETDIQTLREVPQEEPNNQSETEAEEVGEDSESDSDDESAESDIEDVEDEIEDMKDEDEETESDGDG